MIFLLKNKKVFMYFTFFVFSVLMLFSQPAGKKTYADVVNNIDAHYSEFNKELQQVLNAEKDNLLILVDKKHSLPDNYVPNNIIKLKKPASYLLNRNDLSLTVDAEKALEKMARAALKDGVTLVVSSSYRSYVYQVNLFARYSREYGEKTAETFSARPGTSQHQLGTVVDFGSITDGFANTKAGKWLERNAWKYGWSLSFPKGYDDVTGYKWECWHFRYIGVDACRLQQKWFDDVQQYMLEYIHNWKLKNKNYAN